MAIEMDMTCPRIRCDYCGEWILDDGIVNLEPNKPHPPSIKFYHKGHGWCDQHSDAKSVDLDVFLYYLISSLKLDMAKAEKAAKLLAFF